MSTDSTETRPAMDCDDLVRSLDAYLDGELTAAEEGEVAEHLAACAPCEALVRGEERVRTAVRAGLRSALGPASEHGRAPEALRHRILLALARERRPLWRRLVAPLPVAAVAACLAGVLVVLSLHRGADGLAEEAVQRHTRDLPLEVTAAALGPDSVAGWFAGKLDFNAAPLRFGGGDVRLVGARLSHIHDRPAAYVRYALPRGHMGLFILDDPGRRFGAGGREVRIGPATVHLVNARGFNVAVWRRNEIVYSLVSDLDEEALARLVQTAQGVGDR